MCLARVSDAFHEPKRGPITTVTIDRLEQSGLHARVPMLTSIANSLLRRANPDEQPPPHVSHMWPSRWMKAHPQYQIITGKPLAIERKNEHDLQTISDWFRKYTAVLEEYSIHPRLSIHNRME